MPHFPKPFFRESRRLWYVQVDGKQINLGPTEAEAFQRYHELMAEPQKRTVNPQSLAAIIDAFLGWTQKNRSGETYEWYRYRLQRFIERNPNLSPSSHAPLAQLDRASVYGTEG